MRNKMTIFSIEAAFICDEACAILEKPIVINPQIEGSKLVTIGSNGNKLEANFQITADTEESARETASFILESIANAMAFKDIFVKKIKMSTWFINNVGKKMCSRKITLSVKGTVAFPIKGKKLIELKNFINSKISDAKQQDYLLMYRQAINENNTAMKFLLLFRLLETIHGTRKAADSFIKKERPSIEIKQDRNGAVSTITWLRDHVHAKNKSFPYQKITENVGILQELTKKAMLLVIK